VLIKFVRLINLSKIYMTITELSLSANQSFGQDVLHFNKQKKERSSIDKVYLFLNTKSHQIFIFVCLSK
jgi:hypothetical protein